MAAADSLESYLDLPLVTFKFEPASSNVVLDQEPLLKVLHKLYDCLKETVTKGFAGLREEFDMQLSGLRSELGVALAETTESMESRLATKAALQELAEGVTERSEQAETRQSRVLERVNVAVERADRALNTLQALAGKIESGEPVTLSEQPLVITPVGFAESSIAAESPLPARRTSSLPMQRASIATVGSGELTAKMEMLDALKGDLDGCRLQLDGIENRMERDMAKYGERLDRQESSLRSCRREQGQRLDDLEAGARKQSAEASDLAKEMRSGKAEVSAEVEALKEQVTQLEGLMERACMTESLEIRVAGCEQRTGALERRAASTESSSKDVQRAVQSLEENLATSEGRIDKCVEQLAQVGREAKTQLDERCRVFEREGAKTLERLGAAEAELGVHVKLLGGLSEKAGITEVAALRATLSSLAEDVKEKEQAVLFGARCLSCNRVFDDVQPEAGVVNLRSERQRAQVLADLQRALHTPRTDPSQPIKMLAVKVGRPAQISSSSAGLGPFEGRDASSLSWSAEDVSLLPVRDTAGAERTLRAPSSARVGDGRRGGGAERARGVSANSALAPKRAAAPREGAMDFGEPLSRLVGRS